MAKMKRSTPPLLTVPYNVYYKDENDVVRGRERRSVMKFCRL